MYGLIIKIIINPTKKKKNDKIYKDLPKVSINNILKGNTNYSSFCQLFAYFRHKLNDMQIYTYILFQVSNNPKT